MGPMYGSASTTSHVAAAKVGATQVEASLATDAGSVHRINVVGDERERTRYSFETSVRNSPHGDEQPKVEAAPAVGSTI